MWRDLCQWKSPYQVPYPVERIVEQPVIKEVEVIKEVVVVVEKTVEKVVTKEVPVERVVYRELPMDSYIEKSKYEALEREVRRLQKLLEQKEYESRNSTMSSVHFPVTSPSPIKKVYPEEAPLYNSRPRDSYQGSPKPQDKMVGLGLSLSRSSMERTTYVTGTIPGYAAHHSGKLFVDDILEAVDDVDVSALNLEEIKGLTVGPENSVCALTLRRAERQLAVHLVRKAAEV